MSIARNRNGTQKIADLRRAAAANRKLSVTREGGNWQIKNLINGAWIITTCPYHYDERAALQDALWGQPETAQEAAYYAKK